MASPRDDRAQPIMESSEPAKDRCFLRMEKFNNKNKGSYLTMELETEPLIQFFDDNTGDIRRHLGDGTVGQRDNFRPKCVAIGPRFWGQEGLNSGEELKHAAAYDFWHCSDVPFSALYSRVEDVAAKARGSYASPIDGRITDEELTAMLFTDGCFLLQLICIATDDGAMASAGSRYHVTNLLPVLLVDIFVVENQIPWIVLRALMSVRPVQVMRFIDMLVAGCFDKQMARPGHAWGESADDCEPIHLLDLLYKQQTGQASTRLTLGDLSRFRQQVIPLTSASELAEAGVQIRPSRTPRFADVHFQRRWLVFGRLLLPPLQLSPDTVPIIINMMAFELLHSRQLQGRSHMAAYIGMFSTLISTEEDVRQLRRKGIFVTTLSDKDVMGLIKRMEPHIQSAGALTAHPLRVLITTFFKRHRPWIALHRFVYHNLRFLLAIGSFLSVSLSILKAILSLRDSPMAAPAGNGH